jgi:hypothetical protein
MTETGAPARVVNLDHEGRMAGLAQHEATDWRQHF